MDSINRTTFYKKVVGFTPLKNLNNAIDIKPYLTPPKSYFTKLLTLIYLRTICTLRSILYRFDIYTNDIHSLFVFYYIGNQKYTLIEDGLANYIPQKPKPENIFRKSLSFIIPTGLIENKRVKSLLTQHSEIERSEKISLQRLWTHSSEEKKQLIKNVFGLTDQIISSLKGKSVIIFTQPLSEDWIIPYEEKIEYYKKTIESISVPIKEIVIKTHPRETTDYQSLFPNIFVFKENIPQELINLCGIRFKTAYTISSTAAMNFDYPIEIIPIRTGKNLAGEDTFLKMIENKYKK